MGRSQPVSPRILSIEWGRMEIENIGIGRDFKLWPGGGRPWDWNETGTHHTPGIQPSDIEELLVNGSEILIFGSGMNLGLGLSRKAVDYLEIRNLQYYYKGTKEAVEIYNDIASEGKGVGGLFHSTC